MNAMRQSLGQRQTQNLRQQQVIRARQIQVNEIQALTRESLAERIWETLRENPFLEVRDPPPTTESGPETSSESWSDDYSEENSYSSEAREELSDRHTEIMANVEARPMTLADHLHEQLVLELSEGTLRKVADKIIYNLDERGWINGPLEEIFPNVTEAGKEMVERALRLVQKLEPAGVGARNLQECLLLQLDPDDPDFRDMKRLVSNYLGDLERNRLPYLSRITGLTLTRIQECRRKIAQLNPDPGRDFRGTISEHVTPDVLCFKAEDGTFHVRLMEAGLPEVGMNQEELERFSQTRMTRDERDKLRKKLNAATWLLDAIEQRRTNLLNISRLLVEYQQKFLEEGDSALRPLTRRHVASELDLHDSTVSRIVREKWMQTPRGILSLSRFFSSGVGKKSAHGLPEENVSKVAIQQRIRELVATEDRKNPKSDEKLMETLRKEGFQIARRTVRKYRDEMGIPSSRLRKEY